jgi:hypothetical protein
MLVISYMIRSTTIVEKVKAYEFDFASSNQKINYQIKCSRNTLRALTYQYLDKSISILIDSTHVN